MYEFRKVHMEDRAVGPVSSQAAVLADVFEVLVDRCVHSQTGGIRRDSEASGCANRPAFTALSSIDFARAAGRTRS